MSREAGHIKQCGCGKAKPFFQKDLKKHESGFSKQKSDNPDNSRRAFSHRRVSGFSGGILNKAGLPDNRRAIARILRNPRLWGERYLRNRDGGARRYWPHQNEDLECTAGNIIHLDGRDSGKTVDIATLALHHAFVRKGGSVLVYTEEPIVQNAINSWRTFAIGDEIQFNCDDEDVKWEAREFAARVQLNKLIKDSVLQCLVKGETVCFKRPTKDGKDIEEVVCVNPISVKVKYENGKLIEAKQTPETIGSGDTVFEEGNRRTQRSDLPIAGVPGETERLGAKNNRCGL